MGRTRNFHCGLPIADCGLADRDIQSEIRNPKSEIARLGFTLVELLVVITIIGILASLIVVAAVGALKTAARTRIKAELNQIAGGVDECRNKTNAYPPNCQTDGSGPLDENTVALDLQRYIKIAFVRQQEPSDLILRLAGRGSVASGGGTQLVGGMTAAEALVFWLRGFSSDPKYPISGEGGPSYVIKGFGDPNNKTLDPVTTGSPFFPFDVSRLGPRDKDGYFDESTGRFVEYTDAKNVKRRINFWQYTPAHSEQPYLYFDTSRHAPGDVRSGNLVGSYDPPAATSTAVTSTGSSVALAVYPFKKVNPSYSTTTPNVPVITYVNPDKYQILHCGINGTWDADAFAKMSPGTGIKNDSTSLNALLLFPDGPFIGDIAETIVNFTTETKVEDAQAK
jgi:prepilin-type N-terminal cleavage/methylation domain-containing protein